MSDKSLPYTGSSSASFATEASRQVRQSQEKRKQENSDKRSKLLPAGELLVAEIQKEIDDLKVIDFIKVKAAIAMGEHVLEIDMLSNEKAIEKLNGVKTRLLNVLRDNKE